MTHDRKQAHKREMLGCARIASAERKHGTAEQAAAWNAKAAEHLQKLGGLMGQW